MTGAPEPYLGLASVLGRDQSATDAAVGALVHRFGEPAFVSRVMAFPWTSYYRDELGSEPVRRIVVLAAPTDPSQLAALKRTTCRMEVALSRPGAPRAVNIDPGVLNESQLVLASTKPRAHRIYLGQGIYGDLMLLRQQAGFAALPWTYPDYADAEVRILLDRIRSLLLLRRRLAQPDGGQ